MDTIEELEKWVAELEKRIAALKLKNAGTTQRSVSMDDYRKLWGRGQSCEVCGSTDWSCDH